MHYAREKRYHMWYHFDITQRLSNNIPSEGCFTDVLQVILRRTTTDDDGRRRTTSDDDERQTTALSYVFLMIFIKTALSVKSWLFCIFVFQKNACGGDVVTSFMIFFYRNHGNNQTYVCFQLFAPDRELFHDFNKIQRKSSTMCLKKCRRLDLFATPGMGRWGDIRFKKKT